MVVAVNVFFSLNFFRVRCAVVVLWDGVRDGVQERKMGVEKIFRGRGRMWPIYDFDYLQDEFGRAERVERVQRVQRVLVSRVEFEYSRVLTS